MEASLGKESTEELAVMLDTFRPLYLTEAALRFDDKAYPTSWLEGGLGGPAKAARNRVAETTRKDARHRPNGAAPKSRGRNGKKSTVR